MSNAPAVPQNLLDRAIGYFSPVRAQRRYRARLAMALAGGYAGASMTRRSVAGWITGRRDADADLLYDQEKLRQRSRDLVRNAPVATGAINLAVTNTIGTGLKLQARVDREFLRLDDKAAEKWESDAEREWSLFADSQDCDCARTLTFPDLQTLAFRQVLENGDGLAVLPRFRRAGEPYLLKIQLVEGDRLSNKGYAANSPELMNGVKKDQYGAPVAYQISRFHPGSILPQGKQEWDEIPAFNEKTGLRNVLHLYSVLRAGQTRGVPYLAPVIETLKQLERYTEAELMAAVVSGMFTVFVKSSTGDGLPSQFQPTTETGSTSADEDYKLGNGAIVGLAQDESIDTADPGRPNTAFDPFIASILRQIGMALEIPYEILIRHFSASYSASRAALLEAWRFFRCRRVWMQNHFCQPIYENWLTEAVAFGRIAAPGFFDDPRIRKAYCGTIWIGDAPGQIDPLKEVNAAEKKINLGVSTLDAETVNLTGGDFDRNYPRIRKERRLMQEAGMWVPVSAKTPAQTPDPASDENKGEEGKENETD